MAQGKFSSSAALIKMLLSCLVMFFLLSSANCSFVAKTLGSNMVLQRDVSSAIYGYSQKPTSKITVFFEGSTYLAESSSVKSSSGGGFFWKINLPSMMGGLQPHTIHISSNYGENAVLENVLFGDVFLCGGQSNMQFSIPGEFNAESEIALADKYPHLRIFTVGQDTNAPVPTEPRDDLYSVWHPWAESSSVSVNGSWAGYFSAVCWEFGRGIFDDVLEAAIPLGLISNNWGGTIIQAWSPPEVIDKCENGETSLEMKKKRRGEFNPDRESMSSGNETALDPSVDSSLYYAMVTPFKNMQLKGMLWYQGESNINDGGIYPCLQDAMVRSWRALLGQHFPFMYTQLATWDNGGNNVLPSFRNAQYSILSLTDTVAMVTAADLGDPTSPYGDIHPRNKMEIGRRMALAGASLVYQRQPAAPYLGPIVETIEIVENPANKKYTVKVTFTKDSCGDGKGGGLHLQLPQVCPNNSMSDENGCGYTQLVYYSALMKENITVGARATITGFNTVTFTPIKNPLALASSGRPVKLLYGWGDYPLLTVYNSWNIPLIPFEVNLP